MWQQIQANRRRSAIFLCCMVAILLALGYLAGEAIAPHQGGPIGLLVAFVIWAIQMLVYFTAAEEILLGTASAHELKHEDSPRLFNIVEEMKIASGLGYMPRIFLIDDATPNAFAIGRNPGSAAVAVTTGLMQRLNRDELQGVIAHEIGHLKNGDVKFMTLAAVMLGSIILLADLFWRIMRGTGRSSSRSDSRGGGGGQAQAILFVIAIVFMILAPVLAQLLYFACSRKREYLADASSAQFTRYPEGLASALQKLAAAQHNPSFASRVTAPMFIVNPLQASDDGGFNLFATHPPTSERVRILRSMAGAGLGDYEAAYRKVRSGDALIDPNWTQMSAHEDVRPQSEERGDGFALREVRTMVHRLDGYVTVACPCGLTTNVPMQFEGNEVHCVRCGRTLPLPTALEREAAPDPVAAERKSSAGQPPLQYVRKTQGWESFRCQCGRTIQLSPLLRAPHLTCGQCGRQIEIVPVNS